MLVAIFLCFISLANAYETIIISDLDDTIKQTNVDDTGDAAENSLFTKKIFKGMDDLFSTVDTDLYVLTNSPNILRRNIFRLFQKFSLNVVELSTRHIFRDRDGFTYKYNYIANKIKETNQKLILIGDDVGEDPEVYAKIAKNFPNDIAAIYIHIVKNRPLPLGTKPYITSFDIAIHEYLSKRMNLNQAMNLGQALLQDYNLKDVLPDFVYCPLEKDFWNSYNVHELASLIAENAKKITTFCHQSLKYPILEGR